MNTPTCPKDASLLIPHTIRGHSVWLCGKCKGMWLPMAMAAQAMGKARPASANAGGSQAGSLPCPEDGLKLHTLSHLGIEVDFCRRCNGVWLDAGELEHILRTKFEPQREGDPGGWDALNPLDIIQSMDGLGDAVGWVFEFLAEAIAG